MTLRTHPGIQKLFTARTEICIDSWLKSTILVVPVHRFWCHIFHSCTFQSHILWLSKYNERLMIFALT